MIRTDTVFLLIIIGIISGVIIAWTVSGCRLAVDCQRAGIIIINIITVFVSILAATAADTASGGTVSVG